MKISTRRKTIGIIFSAILIIVLLSTLTPVLGFKNKTNSNINTNCYGYGYGYGCSPHTPGYWRNHPDAWPVNSITIGGVTYPKAEAIEIIFHPTKGDKTYNMFEHLVATKLNVLMGCESSCITTVIATADIWMSAHHVGSGVKGDSNAWAECEPLFSQLTDYNEGHLC